MQCLEKISHLLYSIDCLVRRRMRGGVSGIQEYILAVRWACKGQYSMGYDTRI